MDLLNTETLLPGSVTQIMSEYSTGHDRSQFGSTDSVVVIGTAFDGPVGRPVEIYNMQHARAVFGRAYDSRTRKEASLTAGIQDAYQKGCRTIYGVRVSGREVSKEFDFAINTRMRFKVAATNPSNVAKDCILVYDDTDGNETIKIYKPASRATMREKIEGMVVHEEAVMVNTIRLNADLGITKNASLFDLIRNVNNHIDNNVLRLAIVDEDGLELNEASLDARGIPVGALLPGMYAIGRDMSICRPITRIRYDLLKDLEEARFDTLGSHLVRAININTDIASSYPVYASNVTAFRSALSQDENGHDIDITISAIDMFDFLEISGAVDRVFRKDPYDYEEVDVSNFETYKRLGSGYAITCRMEGGKVKEAREGDENRIMPLHDGIYSMLENNGARYRVLASGTVENEIRDGRPAADDFLRATPNETRVLKDKGTGEKLVRIVSRVSDTDLTRPKGYSFTFERMSKEDMAAMEKDVIDNLYSERAFPVISTTRDINKLLERSRRPFETSTLVLEVNSAGNKGKLFRFDGREFIELNQVVEDMVIVADKKVFRSTLTTEGNYGFEYVPNAKSELAQGNKYIMIDNNRRIMVMKFVEGTFEQKLEPVADIETIFSQEEQKTTIFAQSCYNELNDIVVKSTVFDTYNVEEIVELLNAHVSISELFDFSLTSVGYERREEHIGDLVEEDLEEIAPFVLSVDRAVIDKSEVEDEEFSIFTAVKTKENFEGVKINISLADDTGLPVEFDQLFDTLTFIDDETGQEWNMAALGAYGNSVFSYGPADGRDIAENEDIRTEIKAGLSDSILDGKYTITIKAEAGGEILAETKIDVLANVEPEETLSDDFMYNIIVNDRMIRHDSNLYIPYKTTDNFGRQLAQHCVYTSMKNSIPAHGIIGCETISDIGLDGVARKVDRIMALDLDLYAKRPNGRNMLDANNLPYPIGRALSVVFGQDRMIMDDGYAFISNSAAGYAGMASILPLDQSSTNQPIENMSQMFELTSHQLTRLTQKGIVTFKRSFNRGLVVTDGVTMAPAGSPFRRLSVSRIVGAIEELIREASEPFIGKQNNPANRNSLQTALKSRLDKIKGVLIEKYDFRMNLDPRIAKFAYIDIDYDIVPIYEIRQIRNRVTIKDEL